MENITQFKFNASKKNLLVVFDETKEFLLSYEYLRVFSPEETNKIKHYELPKVFNKNNVLIIDIEPLGEDGYNFIFDDGHNAVYSTDYLLMLFQDHDISWKQYQDSLKKDERHLKIPISFQ